MPRTVVVSGSFFRQGQPVHGLVRFTPGRLWVMDQQVAWACLAPEVQLDHAGSFVVQVTATDNDAILWPYFIETPAGTFKVYIPWDECGYTLRGLINEHCAGPRA
jgi:hypothetical protein